MTTDGFAPQPTIRFQRSRFQRIFSAWLILLKSGWGTAVEAEARPRPDARHGRCGAAVAGGRFGALQIVG